MDQYFIFYKPKRVSANDFNFRSIFPKLCGLYGNRFIRRVLCYAILKEDTQIFCGKLISMLTLTVSIVTTAI